MTRRTVTDAAKHQYDDIVLRYRPDMCLRPEWAVVDYGHSPVAEHVVLEIVGIGDTAEEMVLPLASEGSPPRRSLLS